MKLYYAKWWIKISNSALKYPFQAKNISFDTFFFFEAVTIIQIFFRGLGKLAFEPLNGWVLKF